MAFSHQGCDVHIVVPHTLNVPPATASRRSAALGTARPGGRRHETPREPAGIHPDDDGTRLVVIHTDSRARKDSRDLFFDYVGVRYQEA